MACWRKGILVLAVCAVHFAILYKFNAGPQSFKAGAYGLSADNKSRLQLYVVQPAAPALPQPQPAVKAAMSPFGPANAAPTRSLARTPGSEDAPAAPGLKDEDFLDASALDETADPEDGFQSALAQSVPLFFSALEIELWIDSSGQTVRVLCVGAECTQAVTADLQQLLSQHFKPAQKNGLPVASRKLIQIESATAFGM